MSGFAPVSSLSHILLPVRASSLQAHPLTVFSAVLSSVGILVLGCIIVKYKYAGASLTPQALPTYTAVVLTSWIVLPLCAMYTILGTISAIPESDNAGNTWHHKMRRILGGSLFINMLYTLGPLVWVAITTAFAALAHVHFDNAYNASRMLQQQLAQTSEPSAAATAAQLELGFWAWKQFLAGFQCIRIIAILWAANVLVIVISLLVVGGRICHILRSQLQDWKTGPQTKHTPEQVAEKMRYLRESIITLGSFYVLMAISGTILIVSMSVTAHRLSNSDVAEASDAYRIGQLVFMWVVAINGTGLTLLLSGRVFAAASVGAIERKPVTASMLRRRRATVTAEPPNAAVDEEKAGWANTALKRTSGILNLPKLGGGKAAPPCASMTTSGVQVDVEEERVMDVADLDATTSGSRTANSTPMSLLTKLPSTSPSINVASEVDKETLPPWER